MMMVSSNERVDALLAACRICPHDVVVPQGVICPLRGHLPLACWQLRDDVLDLERVQEWCWPPVDAGCVRPEAVIPHTHQVPALPALWDGIVLRGQELRADGVTHSLQHRKDLVIHLLKLPHQEWRVLGQDRLRHFLLDEGEWCVDQPTTRILCATLLASLAV